MKLLVVLLILPSLVGQSSAVITQEGSGSPTSNPPLFRLNEVQAQRLSNASLRIQLADLQLQLARAHAAGLTYQICEELKIRCSEYDFTQVDGTGEWILTQKSKPEKK